MSVLNREMLMSSLQQAMTSQPETEEPPPDDELIAILATGRLRQLPAGQQERLLREVAQERSERSAPV